MKANLVRKGKVICEIDINGPFPGGEYMDTIDFQFPNNIIIDINDNLELEVNGRYYDMFLTDLKINVPGVGIGIGMVKKKLN